MKTKTNEILEYLQENGSITSIQAFEKFGAARLSGIIYNLKKRGHDISTIILDDKDRNGRNCHFANYIYKGVSENVE